MARFCAACGTPLADEAARFCTKCGAAVAAPTSTAEMRLSPLYRLRNMVRKRRTIIIVVAVVVALLVLDTAVTKYNEDRQQAAPGTYPTENSTPDTERFAPASSGTYHGPICGMIDCKAFNSDGSPKEDYHPCSPSYPCPQDRQ